MESGYGHSKCKIRGNAEEQNDESHCGGATLEYYVEKVVRIQGQQRDRKKRSQQRPQHKMARYMLK
jgi:hypothetical protein